MLLASPAIVPPVAKTTIFLLFLASMACKIKKAG
jgi:hypothetical protein